MIYVTGDCHAEFNKLNAGFFKEQKEMTKDDYVIICGDFGGVWADSPSERYWLDWLNGKNFTTLFVCGNHENFDRLYNEFEVVDFHGGKAHKIRDSVYHLMRGNIFDLCGKKFFAFGGASSHDIDDGILDPDDFVNDDDFYYERLKWVQQNKMFRINHQSWWKEELPSQEEMEYGLQTLEANGNKVDYIISHCAPQEIVSIFSYGTYEPDKLTQYFNQIADKVEFKDWYFGHYHNEMTVLGKYHMLYDSIVRIV